MTLVSGYSPSNFKTFSKRTKLAKTAYNKVVARWQELGLPGNPPAVTIFEDENSSGDVG